MGQPGSWRTQRPHWEGQERFVDLSFDDKEKFKDRTMQDITVFSGIVIERLVTHESSLSSRKTEAEVC